MEEQAVRSRLYGLAVEHKVRRAAELSVRPFVGDAVIGYVLRAVLHVAKADRHAFARLRRHVVLNPVPFGQGVFPQMPPAVAPHRGFVYGNGDAYAIGLLLRGVQIAKQLRDLRRVHFPDGLNPAVRAPLHLEIQQALGIRVQGHTGGVGAGVQENPDHVPLVVIDPALFGDSGGLVFLGLFGLQLLFQGF